MPSKKKKYNARFPPARIKKIMQKDEDVGKVAAPVPVLISKALEIFVEALITKSSEHTLSRNAKTLTTSHIKQCIEQESKFDFLRDLVENVPTISCEDEEPNHSGSYSAEKHANSRRKHGINRNTSAQSSIQSVDETSSDEDSFESDESAKEERHAHPAGDSRVPSIAPSSSSSSLHKASPAVPNVHQNSLPHQSVHQMPGTAFPPSMPQPLPLQHGALTGNTPAMGSYTMPHASFSQGESKDDDDSDDDYDA
ncbi:uncharacterized protein [Diadema antillarum]|uniref:uncharacterized protein n=1 Tax=Diadema antillarum TaxID=105358 RepID=UPI003A8A393D